MALTNDRDDARKAGSGPASSVPQAADLCRGKRALIVVAHPDDAVLFAGSLLPHFREISLLHTTDGAPSRRRARRSGFRRRLDYAAARRAEVGEALEAGGIDAEHRILPIQDGRATLFADHIIAEVEVLIASFKPDIILTHAYEGGHRDHDTTVFAVHTAARRQGVINRLWEMACYHARSSGMECAVFPGGDAPDQIVARLSPAEMDRKVTMLDRFRTQRSAVDAYTSPVERFRNGAAREFSRSPCPGQLGYESTDSGLEGAVWRNLMACFLHADRETGPRGLRFQALCALMGLLIISSKLRLRHCGAAGRVERALQRFLPGGLR